MRSLLLLPLLLLVACTSALKGRVPVSELDPRETPPMTQGSIDFALTAYGITLPSGVEPRLEESLEDRGRTDWTPFDGIEAVRIGPSAFKSWALLGSTLAHELEVHCRQNFWAITFQESVGLGGIRDAERAAYRHELESAERFGLSAGEVDRIAATLAAIERL